MEHSFFYGIPQSYVLDKKPLTFYRRFINLSGKKSFCVAKLFNTWSLANKILIYTRLFRIRIKGKAPAPLIKGAIAASLYRFIALDFRFARNASFS